MSHVKVLCVENHVEYLSALKDILQRAGYEVLSATTGSEALIMLAAEPVQGVLLDYYLPDATGIFVRAEMKLIKPHVPVLLFDGGGGQTSFLLQFFDAYVRDASEWIFADFDT